MIREVKPEGTSNVIESVRLMPSNSYLPASSRSTTCEQAGQAGGREPARTTLGRQGHYRERPLGGNHEDQGSPRRPGPACLDNGQAGLVEATHQSMPMLEQRRYWTDEWRTSWSLRSTDLQVTYTGQMPRPRWMTREGALCLPAHKLAELVKLLPEENAHLEGKDHDADPDRRQGAGITLQGPGPFKDFPPPTPWSTPCSASTWTTPSPCGAHHRPGRLCRLRPDEKPSNHQRGAPGDKCPTATDRVLRLVATNGHRMALCRSRAGGRRIYQT